MNLTALFTGIGLKILGAVAAIATIGAILFGARQAGRNAERVEALQRAMENAREAREIERNTRAMSDDELDYWLRHPSRRGR